MKIDWKKFGIDVPYGRTSGHVKVFCPQCRGNRHNKADFGIVVHRNKENETVEVNVDKVRFKHLGEGGTAMFKYNFTNGRYVPYVNETPPLWDNTNHLREKDRERAELEADTTGLLFD